VERACSVREDATCENDTAKAVLGGMCRSFAPRQVREGRGFREKKQERLAHHLLLISPRVAPSRIRDDSAAEADDDGEREHTEEFDAREPPIDGSFDPFFALCVCVCERGNEWEVKVRQKVRWAHGGRGAVACPAK
jgi:hypothetical protein